MLDLLSEVHPVESEKRPKRRAKEVTRPRKEGRKKVRRSEASWLWIIQQSQRGRCRPRPAAGRVQRDDPQVVLFEAGGVTLLGPGEPLGAFIAVLVGYAFGRFITGKTKVDLIIVPLVTIITGGLAGLVVGPPISAFMNSLGAFINWATIQDPLLFGIIIAVVMIAIWIIRQIINID